jgi:flagellar biogenesis protein FliO
MMDDFIGTYGNNLIVAVVGVGVALLVLAIALWLLRRRSGSAPFIRGGRNRQPRLQVLDATAVDARRRLVLVRRDNVEHLVMIGGPTDIVIESGIGAIPIVRDVQEPELKALPRQESDVKKAEPAIPQERRATLPQQQPVATVAPATATEEPVKQPQRPEQPAPAPRPAPAPASAAPLPPRPLDTAATGFRRAFGCPRACAACKAGSAREGDRPPRPFTGTCTNTGTSHRGHTGSRRSAGCRCLARYGRRTDRPEASRAFRACAGPGHASRYLTGKGDRGTASGARAAGFCRA